jgi:hypothetical protein
MLARILLGLLSISSSVANNHVNYDTKPFTVHFSPDEVSRMIALVQNARLPSGDQFYGGDASLGITRANLRDLRHEWVHNYSWDTQEKALNKLADGLLE